MILWAFLESPVAWWKSVFRSRWRLTEDKQLLFWDTEFAKKWTAPQSGSTTRATCCSNGHCCLITIARKTCQFYKLGQMTRRIDRYLQMISPQWSALFTCPSTSKQYCSTLARCRLSQSTKRLKMLTGDTPAEVR